MIVLPQWPAGTVAVLATSGPDGAPGLLPVSTALRAGDARVLLALGGGAPSLAAAAGTAALRPGGAGGWATWR